jgi:hypothetical protein
MRVLPLGSLCSLLAITTVAGCNCGLEPLEIPKPHMKVSPSVVALQGVPVAQDTRIVIQVQNDSTVPLKTLHAEIDPEAPTDPAFTLDESYPKEIFAGQTAEIVLVVRPQVVSTLTTRIIITGDGHDTPLETDDAQPSPRVVVPITVDAIDAGLPDICDYPESIDFDLVGQNDVGRVTVPVKNCGVRDLILDHVVYCPDDAAPAPEAAEVCASLGLDGGEGVSQIRVSLVAPGTPFPPSAGASFEMLFLPVDLDEHTGNLVIVSNDPDENPLVIPVTGEGSACPTAVAEIINDIDDIEPFDSVRFNGSNSIASDGGEFQGDFEWSVVIRPPGSTADVRPADESSSEIEVDLAGRYVINLEVFEFVGGEGNTEGRIRSCQPASVTFDVVPSEELLIQLVWDHPTADLDLHLVRGDGTEFTHEDDCYFSNPAPQQTEEEPDWSPNAEENPVLDVDDDEGYGPENMNIVRPAPGSEWKVLVHYWNQQTDGDARTTATVRVFVYGLQVMEISRVFENEQVLWEALDITWALEELAAPDLAQIGVVRDYPRPF